MTDQKIENLLNLALNATEREREESLELNVGYDREEREWEVIVKYSGNLDAVRAIGIQVVELYNEFAILTVPEDLVERLAEFSQIEYIEKPKRLFFQVANGRRVSCVPPVQNPPFSLFGSGILIAVIDSGIDYANPDFRNEDGTTRIVSLWDQTVAGNPPDGYLLGTEFTNEQINEALKQPAKQGQMRLVPSIDTSGHGTAVAGIAAGNGRGSAGRVYRGVAPQSELLVVKLGIPRKEGFPRTTELIQAIDYVVRKAVFYQRPVAINISFGNTYGSHEPYN